MHILPLARNLHFIKYLSVSYYAVDENNTNNWCFVLLGEAHGLIYSPLERDLLRTTIFFTGALDGG